MLSQARRNVTGEFPSQQSIDGSGPTLLPAPGLHALKGFAKEGNVLDVHGDRHRVDLLFNQRPDTSRLGQSQKLHRQISLLAVGRLADLFHYFLYHIAITATSTQERDQGVAAVSSNFRDERTRISTSSNSKRMPLR